MNFNSNLTKSAKSGDKNAAKTPRRRDTCARQQIWQTVRSARMKQWRRRRRKAAAAVRVRARASRIRRRMMTKMRTTKMKTR